MQEEEPSDPNLQDDISPGTVVATFLLDNSKPSRASILNRLILCLSVGSKMILQHLVVCQSLCGMEPSLSCRIQKSCFFTLPTSKCCLCSTQIVLFLFPLSFPLAMATRPPVVFQCVYFLGPCPWKSLHQLLPLSIAAFTAWYAFSVLQLRGPFPLLLLRFVVLQPCLMLLSAFSCSKHIFASFPFQLTSPLPSTLSRGLHMQVLPCHITESSATEKKESVTYSSLLQSGHTILSFVSVAFSLYYLDKASSLWLNCLTALQLTRLHVPSLHRLRVFLSLDQFDYLLIAA